ncbi:XkdX family protein [Weissella bombi]
MRDIVITLFKMGIYTEDNLPLFVQAAFISQDDYKELTGKDYQPA